MFLSYDGPSLSYLHNSMLDHLKEYMDHLSRFFCIIQLNEYCWQLCYHICLFQIVHKLVFILEFYPASNVILSEREDSLSIYSVYNEVSVTNIANGYVIMFSPYS